VRPNNSFQPTLARRARTAELDRYMIMDEQSKREKLAAKILYWGLVVPTIFAVFWRIFFISFGVAYGFLIVRILGQNYADIAAGLALITSLGFTAGVLIWVHKQYKKHILSTF
jgi:hypothetical protein